jgi:tRNA1(Val) A37 N6-methylase TrmN6
MGTISRYNNLVDIGSGTGILPIIASEKGKFYGKIHAIDK